MIGEGVILKYMLWASRVPRSGFCSPMFWVLGFLNFKIQADSIWGVNTGQHWPFCESAGPTGGIPVNRPPSYTDEFNTDILNIMQILLQIRYLHTYITYCKQGGERARGI